jgi:hypothetical protein
VPRVCDIRPKGNSEAAKGERGYKYRSRKIFVWCVDPPAIAHLDRFTGTVPTEARRLAVRI